MSNSLDNLRAAASKPEGGGFSLEAWHAMEDRDNALVADQLMHGAMSSAFVYSFTGEDGEPATGISVVGARHLAAHYGGIKHRIVWTMDKRGSRTVMVTHPHGDTPGAMAVFYEKGLEAETDWYRCTVEVTDIKTGNTLQRTMEENREGTRKDGSSYAKPHYAVIAESKAYRNAVLDLIPQDLTMAFKQKALTLGRSEDLTVDLIGAKRDHVIAYATSRAITINRRAVQALSFAQIAGLSDAARAGGLDSFHASLSALGLLHFPEGAPAPAPASPSPTPTLSPRERVEEATRSLAAEKVARSKPTPRAKPTPPPPPEPGTTAASLRAATPGRAAEEAASAIPEGAAARQWELEAGAGISTISEGGKARSVEADATPPAKAASTPPAADIPARPGAARSLAAVAAPSGTADMPTRSRRTPAAPAGGARVNGAVNASLAFGSLE